jgi:RNA polymerase sigma-70 factor (ECF subfamily)
LAYVLREACDYPYREIADILQMEEANARQLVSRAVNILQMAGAHPSVPGSNDAF